MCVEKDILGWCD